MERENIASHLFISSLSPRLHIQILGRERLLLPLLPPPAQPRPGGALPEGAEEILNQEDWLRGCHEDTLHQRSVGTGFVGLSNDSRPQVSHILYILRCD